jgi:hypothetical protein
MTLLGNGRRIAAVCASLAAATLVWAIAAGAATDAAKNLIVNGNAEQGEGVNDVNGVATEIPGWTQKGKFTVVKYSAPGGFPDATVQAAVKGGNNFFAGGPANAASSVTQDISVSSKKALIDSGKAKATLSGHLGGYASQNDALIASATFLSASGAKLGKAIKIGPVGAAPRNSQTSMLKKTTTGAVPKKTRTIRVTLGASRTSGSYNDGYADNLTLTLGR